MSIDYSKTFAAFNRVADQMEFLTRVVHAHVLSDDYLGCPGKAKRLLAAIHKVAGSNNKLLLQTFIGKMHYKVPALHLDLKERLTPFEYQRAKIIAAGVVTNVILDNGMFEVSEEVKAEKIGNSRKFRTYYYIELGGTPEKDLYKGIHLDPGVVNQTSVGTWKLTGAHREFLSEIASVPYKIWSGCTEQLLMKGYSLKTDWNKKVDKHGNRLKEDPILKKYRYKLYSDKIVNHVKRFPRFYLSAKYCHRYRTYYEAATLEGIRPQGKLWETLMIDCAEPYDLTEDDERVLKHIIYVVLHGRANEETAVKKFTEDDLLTAQGMDPIQAQSEKEFGKAILLNKAAKAIEDYRLGNPSTSIFGLDFTNSGLMMSGLSFHSKEMMKAANLGAHKTVYDSHTEFGNSFDLELTRDDVKKLQTPLLHGSSIKTLHTILTEKLGKEISERQVEERIEKAYGPCVRNIVTVADWGTLAFGNRQSILRWTLPDGFKAGSRAHMDGVPIRIYVASARHEIGYNQYIVRSNMPLVEDKNGYPVYDKDTELDGVHYPVTVHKRGLFADITHGNDAYVLRCVVRSLREAKRPFLLKHDDYITTPASQRIVKRAAQDAFSDLYEHNTYQRAMEEIKEHSPYDLEVPTLVIGDAPNTASHSENFLMP